MTVLGTADQKLATRYPKTPAAGDSATETNTQKILYNAVRPTYSVAFFDRSIPSKVTLLYSQDHAREDENFGYFHARISLNQLITTEKET